MSDTVVLSTSPIHFRWRDHQVELPALQVNAGCTLGVMGPSGSGKSTLLRWLLGDAPNYVKVLGKIYVAGERVDELAIAERSMGIVFQDILLFPHLSVMDNLLFALPRAQRKLARQDQIEHVLAELEQVQLAKYAQAFPTALSGGQRARVGLLRALLNEPRVLLLDEPFAALDQSLRERIRDWAFQRCHERGIATVMVSHQSDDFATATDNQVAVMQWPESQL